MKRLHHKKTSPPFPAGSWQSIAGLLGFLSPLHSLLASRFLARIVGCTGFAHFLCLLVIDKIHFLCAESSEIRHISPLPTENNQRNLKLFSVPKDLFLQNGKSSLIRLSEKTWSKYGILYTRPRPTSEKKSLNAGGFLVSQVEPRS